DQFDCVFAHGVGLAVAPAIVDAEVLPNGPTQLLQALRKSRQTAVSFRIICSEWREHADAAHPLALLRARRERPRCRAAEQRDEVAPSYVTCHAPLPRRHAQSNNITSLFRSFSLFVARRPRYVRLHSISDRSRASSKGLCPRLWADVTPLKLSPQRR